jgi:PKD repeat protein
MRGGSVLLSLAFVACLALAGCSSKSDSTSSTAASGSDTASSSGGSSSGGSTGGGSSSTGPSSSSGASGPNAAPVITTFTVNKTTGAAPLKVSFAVNATDADKDALTYTLSYGDKTPDSTGKTLPSLLHTYAVAGNYTAKLTVSDGKAAANKTVALKVTGAGALASKQSFYFSSAEQCSGDDLIADLSAAADDNTFCTFQPTAPLGTASKVGPEVATAKTPTGAFPKDTVIQGSIFASSCTPAGTTPNLLQGDFTISVSANGASLGSQKVSIATPAIQGYSKMDFTFQAGAAIPAGATLVLSIDYTGAATGIVWGGGSAHPTGFAVGGPYTP